MEEEKETIKKHCWFWLNFFFFFKHHLWKENDNFNLFVLYFWLIIIIIIILVYVIVVSCDGYNIIFVWKKFISNDSLFFEIELNWYNFFGDLKLLLLITISTIMLSISDSFYHHHHCLLSKMIKLIITIIIIIDLLFNLNQQQSAFVVAKPNYPLLRGVTFRVSFFFVVVVEKAHWGQNHNYHFLFKNFIIICQIMITAIN